MVRETTPLESVLEPLAISMGFELVELLWAGDGGRRILRINLDKEGGISVGDCARMSRIISNALDSAEGEEQESAALKATLAVAYTLEVSSPGLERPLTKRSHFARFLGKRACVLLASPLSPERKQKTFHCVIEAVSQDESQPDNDRTGSITVRTIESEDTDVIPMSKIRRANLVYEG